MDTPRNGARGKLAELEALRGIAALIVLVHHTMLAFTPRLHGLTYPGQAYSLSRTPAFALVNGSAAVVVFFVLSGYVLSLGVLRTGRAQLAATSALKRWPRLAGPVMLTNLMAGLVMALGGFSNQAVAPLVPSIWLGWFYTWPSAGLREIPDSLWEGATTFFTGHAAYNSSLWTMFYEFADSLLVLGAALLMVRLERLRWVGLVSIGCAAFCISPWLTPFLVGLGLAWRDRTKREDWGSGRILLAVSAILLLAGYHENVVGGRPEGFYAALAPVAEWDALRLRVVLHTIAACLALLLFRRSAGLRRAMSGRLGRGLGFLSFGIYLCQVLIICSVSSLTFEATAGAGRFVQIAATFGVTMLGTVVLAVPVAVFDRWWTGWVGRVIPSRGRRANADRSATAEPSADRWGGRS
ncbi:acyltransferase family protein [Aureimonas ureilytica]|uniref:acyltransferase family protein n=1 Tax=Aureimonas ureilytica TaxID=401562 RepID=UPI0009E6BC5E|nr:acyltransferase [Aureimonas ureilytica]